MLNVEARIVEKEEKKKLYTASMDYCEISDIIRRVTIGHIWLVLSLHCMATKLGLAIYTIRESLFNVKLLRITVLS